jgi:hypothetical protein
MLRRVASSDQEKRVAGVVVEETGPCYPEISNGLRPLQKQVSRSVSANIVSAIHQQQIF